MNTIFGPYQGIVQNVHDGDTIDVQLDLGFDLKVYARCRIYEINAPELSTDAGKAARDFAKKTLPVDLPVTVISHGWDKYGGRIDATILYGSNDLDFGTTMVETGHAVVRHYS